MPLDHTHDAARTSWLASANTDACDFPIQNLPFAVFRRAGRDEAFRGGVAIGDQVIDMAKLATLLHTNASLPDAAARAIQACAQARLNDFLALGQPAWTALRHALVEWLDSGASGVEVDSVKASLVPLSEIEYTVPVTIGDYTDFYTSVHHAVNIGNLIRPDDPLTPNFRWIPIAYHGRVSSIGVSGQRVRRPRGQSIRPGTSTPVYAPCAMLDYELELGVYVGRGTEAGTSLSVDQAEAHLFGICLLNDWSARDIQWWEMAPLGPFLAKNFATTISPWIVTMDALAPYRSAWHRDADQPQPLDYLESARNRESGALDIRLQVSLQSADARAQGRAPARVSETTFTHQYWSIAQMLAHHTSGGCAMNVGDLFGSGTISGPGDGEAGALIELSRGGRTPVAIGAGETRAYLEDGDTVILRGWCERDGFARIGFGECRGEVMPVHG